VRRRPLRNTGQHHPDPSVENDLERIRALRQRCQVKDDQINDYRAEIEELHKVLRKWGRQLSNGHGAAPSTIKESIGLGDKRVVQLQGEIRQLEQDADQAREQIGAIQVALSASDLAFL
jgi:chromosome segregation ATPase